MHTNGRKQANHQPHTDHDHCPKQIGFHRHEKEDGHEQAGEGILNSPERAISHLRS